MGTSENIENLRAAREAQDAVVGRPKSSSSSAIEEALKRYLGAEQYHEFHDHEGRKEASDAGSDEQEGAQ